MTNAIASPAIAKLTTLVANAQRQLPAGRPLRPVAGSVVRVLSDGSVGEVTWAGPIGVILVHGDRELGRGPWPMYYDQLEVVDADVHAAYLQRCVSRYLAGRAVNILHRTV